MNRIQTLTQREPTVAFAINDRPVPARRSIISASANAYFVPLHYEPNYAYPLVVWLHGPHDNELQLKKVFPHVSMRNYIGLGPRATAYSEQDDGSRIRFRWLASEMHVNLAEQRVLEAIDEATERWNIGAGRTFIAGLQCGGTMALRLALRNPDRFAGALSFGGPFPTSSAPLARLRQVRRLPLFLAIMGQSEFYPQQQVCQHLRLFHSAHLKVTIHQYLLDKELTTDMLSDMDRWLMQQVTGTAGVPSPSFSDRLLN